VPDEMAFSLDWLNEALGRLPQLTVCPDGHLVVRHNTHWQPVGFAPDGRALTCRVVEHEEAT
jgi:hypothetical protein